MSSLLDRAIVYATEKHSGQKRKLVSTPYILHPLEVAVILSTMTDDEEVIVSGILHDTIEDTTATAEEVRTIFGERVYKLVASESENKRKDRPASETWQIRKEESLAELKNTKDLDVKRLWLADKLANLRSIDRQMDKCDNLWDSFHQNDPKLHRWYYQSVADAATELADTDAYREYIDLVHQIFD